MTEVTRYRTNRHRIGRMNERVYVYAPLMDRTVDGYPHLRYILWTDGPKKAEVNPSQRNTGEEVIAERMTALNAVTFRMRYRSQIDERYIIRWENEDYEIESIQRINDSGPRYVNIHAVRRNQSIEELTQWSDTIFMDYTQGPENVTGTEWAISAGTLPDIAQDNWDEDRIHQLLTVNRASTLLQYGVDFTIDTASNSIVLTQQARGESFLLVQKQVLSS